LRGEQQKTSTPDLPGSVLQRTLTTALPWYFFPRTPEETRCDGDGSESDPSSVSSSLRQELAADSGTPLRFVKDQYRPSHRLYGGRGMPDGRDRWSSMSPVPQAHHSVSPSCEDLLLISHNSLYTSSSYRETSLDSLCADASSLCGGEEEENSGMLDLVQNAREVRRLIREVSLDSEASDLSLADFGLGGGEYGQPWRDGNCTANRLMDSRPEDRSSYEPDIGGSMRRDDTSCPDIAGLQSMRRSSQSLWRLTHFTGGGGREDSGSLYGFSRHASVASSDAGSLLEWESPAHWHDVKPVKLALYSAASRNYNSSNNVSEFGDDVGSGCDPWEWDNDDVCYYVDGEAVLLPEEVSSVQRPHDTWLPSEDTELDLETELGGATAALRRNSLASASSSRRSSVDVLQMRRLPPSGRSSTERSCCDPSSSLVFPPSNRSADTTGEEPSSGGGLVSRTAPFQNNNSYHHHHRHRRHNSVSSDESGFLEGEAFSSAASNCSSLSSSMLSSAGPMESSMNTSCLFTSSINLSPVKEAKEEGLSTLSPPPRKSPADPPPYSGRKKSLADCSSLSPEIRLGDITTTDTVIKIMLPVESGRRPSVGDAGALQGRRLFQEQSKEEERSSNS
jgi:hypothetical protein